MDSVLLFSRHVCPVQDMPAILGLHRERYALDCSQNTIERPLSGRQMRLSLLSDTQDCVVGYELAPETAQSKIDVRCRVDDEYSGLSCPRICAADPTWN